MTYRLSRQGVHEATWQEVDRWYCDRDEKGIDRDARMINLKAKDDQRRLEALPATHFNRDDAKHRHQDQHNQIPPE